MEVKGILLEARYDDYALTEGRIYEVFEIEEHRTYTIMWFFDDEDKLSYHIQNGFPSDCFNVYYQI